MNLKLLIYLGCNVTFGRPGAILPHHIRYQGENCGLLDAGKCVRETARQLRIDQETICRWRDRLRSTGEVNDRSSAGRPRATSARQAEILKLQLFWCDPESIKCPELCYFTPIFHKQGIKSKLTLKGIWPNIQNYFCVFLFWSRAFFSWWGETFWGEFIKQIMNIFSFVQWNKYFHSLVEWNISSFTSWKYLYHCTHKHSLFVYHLLKMKIRAIYIHILIARIKCPGLM